MGLGFRPRLSRPVQNGVELYFQIFSSVPSEQGRHWQFLGVCSSYPLSRDGFAVRTRRARVCARKPGNFPSAEKTTRCALYRLATAPISRSHSPSVPRKPSSQADCQLSRAAVSLRLPLLVSDMVRKVRRETKMCDASGSCSLRIFHYRRIHSQCCGAECRQRILQPVMARVPT